MYAHIWRVSLQIPGCLCLLQWFFSGGILMATVADALLTIVLFVSLHMSRTGIKRYAYPLPSLVSLSNPMFYQCRLPN